MADLVRRICVIQRLARIESVSPFDTDEFSVEQEYQECC